MKINLTTIPTFYLNLDSKVERNESITEVLSSIGINNAVRISGVVIDGEPTKSYSQSYANIIDAGIQNNVFPFAILEDDIRLMPNYSANIEVPDDAACVFTGLIAGYRDMKISKVNGFKNVYRTLDPAWGHATVYIDREYAIKARDIALGLVQDIVPDGRQIVVDHAIGSLAEDYKLYAITPIFYQHDPSNPAQSNATRIVDLEKLKLDPISYEN
jgi:hypothetical protein